MQYVLSLIFALILVLAQSLWKVSVDAHKAVFGGLGSVGLSRYLAFIFAPLTIAGLIIYVLATAFYMYLLSRYDYSRVQAVTIPLSLLFAVIVATLFFGERLSAINLVGIVVIGVGLVLVVLK